VPEAGVLADFVDAVELEADLAADVELATLAEVVLVALAGPGAAAE
jgi:hypothetical protein